jgi:hypothetical protein
MDEKKQIRQGLLLDLGTKAILGKRGLCRRTKLNQEAFP